MKVKVVVTKLPVWLGFCLNSMLSKCSRVKLLMMPKGQLSGEAADEQGTRTGCTACFSCTIESAEETGSITNSAFDHSEELHVLREPQEGTAFITHSALVITWAGCLSLVQHNMAQTDNSHQAFSFWSPNGVFFFLWSPQEGTEEAAPIRNSAFSPHMGLHIFCSP